MLFLCYFAIADKENEPPSQTETESSKPSNEEVKKPPSAYVFALSGWILVLCCVCNLCEVSADLYFKI